MSERRVWTFFYGSFMNRAVVARQGVTFDDAEVTLLPGFAIRMQPLSNVVPDESACVYGLLVRLTHRELARLYAHLPDASGGAYLPEAVLVQTREGAWRPALCYVAPAGAPKPAASEYLGHILEAGQEYSFPAWYLQQIEETAYDRATPRDR